MKLIQVTMGLTEQDASYADKLKQKLHTENRAGAVSAALTITAELSDMLEDGKELILRDQKGRLERIFIPGLTK